ncbi:unnamed protein product [Schistosoma margrebowiei]|uniref:Uncharacterized protein n=1 Tax=Schistosoma margrebowiei TaxID=48269 RepID=A0A183LU26_9TREM|nr:unnamed protein product [Schistosoma margrebowiei]
MVAGDQRLVHTPFVPAGYWSPCAPLVFISSSYDASTHFESTCADVLDLYERIVGKPFELSKLKRYEEVNE